MADGKNRDIGDILDSMWGDGKLHIGKKARKSVPAEQDNAEASAAVNMTDAMKASIKNAESSRQAISGTLNLAENTNASVQSSLEELTRQVQEEMTGLNERLKADGLYSEKSEENTDKSSDDNAKFEEKLQGIDVDSAIETAKGNVLKSVVGEDEFVSAVALTFKRFFVGRNENMPAARAVLLGPKGTGKHLTLESMTEELKSEGLLLSSKITYIDMARYSDSAADKLFIQDFFVALKSESQTIVFENFERAHNTVNSMLSQLFIKGGIPLSSRYTEQKGMLVDIGTALVPNAISEMTAAGKFLFIITGQNEKKLIDTFGMQFVNSVDGICKTDMLSEKVVEEIAGKQLESFVAEAKARLGYELTYGEDEAKTLVKAYIPDEGAESMSGSLSLLMKALGEQKLNSAEKAETGEIITADGVLKIKLGGVTVEASKTGETAENAIAEVKTELNEIVGLDFIKKYILSLEDNLKVQQMRKQKGLKADFPSMHMIFTGNPGTGKTTIARIISRYLKAAGLLSGGQLVEVTRADLVGRYVGHTAPLTQKAIDSALGGVLFIDEAYSLCRGNDDSFGLEAIDTLVKGMEDNRENLVLILAGYTIEMEEFLTANSGLKSRFPNIIEFPDYTGKELLEISKSIAKSKGYTISKDCDAPLEVYYDIQQKTGDPRTNGNGRMARNKVEEAILNCSKRNVNASGDVNLEELIPQDFELEAPQKN